MTESEEQIIREMLSDKIGNAIAYDYVIPAPIYFTGKEDFFATKLGDTDDDPETAYEIDTTHLAFACFYMKNPLEDLEGSAPHSPLSIFTYELYLFSEYDFERADETLTPDAFNKLMLKRHNEFIASIVQLKEAFQGEINFTGLSGYTESKTLPLILREEIQNNVDCEFVQGVKGNSIRIGVRVRLQTEDC